MPEKDQDQLSRVDEYQQRLAHFMESARQGLERQAPEALDRLAVTARNIAERLDHMADEARRKRAEETAASGSTTTSTGVAEPPDDPPVA